MKKLTIILGVLALMGCGKQADVDLPQVGDANLGTEHVKQLFAKTDTPKEYATAIASFFAKYGTVAFMDNISKDEKIYQLVLIKSKQIAQDERFEKPDYQPIIVCKDTALEFIQFAELRKSAGKQNDASDAHRQPFFSNLQKCLNTVVPVATQPAQEQAIVQTPEATPPVLNDEQSKQEARYAYQEVKKAQKQAIKTLEFLKEYPEQGGEIRDVNVMFNNIIQNARQKEWDSAYTSCKSFINYAQIDWEEKYQLIQHEKSNAVTMSELERMKNTKKWLAENEADCKESIK